MNSEASVGKQPPLPQFGRYETTGILGRGAFGTVYEAIDPALDSSVAIKVLADNFSTDAETRQRFIKEARFLRRIGTDRLVGVYDIGEREGQPYFVMELVPGGTLTDRVDGRDGPLTRADLRRVTSELRSALEAIHRAGVIHRDIKPSNLLIQGELPPDDGALLGDGERIVLGDFGLARDIDASALTVAGGTDGFMSPEQRVPGSPVDERSDIFAATAVVADLARTGGVEITPAMTRAFDNGMQADPADRPASVDAWEDLLLAGLADEPAGSAPPEPPPPPGANQPVPPAPPASPSSVAPPPPPATAPTAAASSPPVAGWARVAAVGFVVATVAFALLGAVLLVRGNDSRPNIVGPAEIEVGDVVTYQAEVREGSEYFWTDWGGTRHDGPALDVGADSVGVLPITLTEVRDGNESSRELVVRVVAP